MTKTEELAREVLKGLNGGEDPFLNIVGGSTMENVIDESLPLDVILDLIIDFISRLFAIFNENCQNGPFANRVRKAGPFQEMMARRQWRLLQREEGVWTGISSREIVKISSSVAATKDDDYLNEAAAEPTEPNWMF